MDHTDNTALVPLASQSNGHIRNEACREAVKHLHDPKRRKYKYPEPNRFKAAFDTVWDAFVRQCRNEGIRVERLGHYEEQAYLARPVTAAEWVVALDPGSEEAGLVRFYRIAGNAKVKREDLESVQPRMLDVLRAKMEQGQVT